MALKGQHTGLAADLIRQIPASPQQRLMPQVNTVEKSQGEYQFFLTHKLPFFRRTFASLVRGGCYACGIIPLQKSS
jgi:hypothetical protein